MPFSLDGVQTQDVYTDTCELQPDKNTIQCSFYCLDNPVMVQVFKRNPRMPLSQPIWDGVERFYAAGSGDTFVGPIGGVKFRSANAGSSARIFGVQTFATDVTSMASGFGGGPGSPFSGGGIQYAGPGAVYGPDNSGESLDSLSTAGPNSDGYGTSFTDSGGFGIGLIETAVAPIVLQSAGTIDSTATGIKELVNGVNNAGIEMTVGDTNNSGITGAVSGDDNSGIQLTVVGTNNGGIELLAGGNGAVNIQANSLGQLGFFNAGPVTQQAGAGITTVAQLVAALQAYGLLS